MNAVFLRAIFACLLTVFGALPAWSKEPVHVVIRPVVNLHTTPLEDSELATQALLGARLVELERKGAWARVKTEDDYTAWIQVSALRALEGSERYPVSMEPGKVVEVDALGANLYLDPKGARRTPIMTVPFGVRLERVLGNKDVPDWIEVKLPDGRVVWIQAGDVRTDLKPLDIPASVELAKRFLGINYTWGGTSSFGFDCSGFTQTILRSRGVLMPRDARLQVVWPGLTPLLDRSQLQPGDLLFFGKDLAHVAHTGMVLDRRTFIHDTSRGRPCIQVSDLADPYWSKLLVAIRRLK